PLSRAHNNIRLTARQFTAIKDGFKDIAGLRRQFAEPDLFFGPQENPGAQTVWLNEPFHEGDLINADGEKKPREIGERFFTQRAAPVEIVAARLIAVGKKTLVLLCVAGKPASAR